MADYYEESERLDNEYLTFFNNNVKWFDNLKRNDRYDRIDWYGVDKRGRNCSIELKLRYCDIFKWETIFIEVEKYNHMMNIYKESGYIPLFINFFQDGKNVGIFDLRKFKNLEVIKKVILDPGDNQTKLVERYLLPVRDCSFYQFENNKFVKRW